MGGRWGRGWTSRRGCRVVMVWFLLITLTVSAIKPLRNALLYPVWPSQWRNLGSLRLIERHVSDLFFPMDRSPYSGNCANVTARIEKLGILRKAKLLNRTFHLYPASLWPKAVIKLRQRHDNATLKELTYFRPALTETEQRRLLHNLYVMTSALEAFNVSYMAAEGTLIGAMRHGGMIPWDDDADVTFNANQWQTAKRVLSCIPGFELKIYSDFLWKFYSLDSPLWKDETVARFPYVDLFPYVEDDEYVWPLVIWLKDKMLWPRKQVFPTKFMSFDNFRIRAPRDVAGVLTHLFGDVSICESRLFERRERRLTTSEERIRLKCRLLYDVYQFKSW